MKMKPQTISFPTTNANDIYRFFWIRKNNSAEYYGDTAAKEYGIKLPRVICADGWSVSIQAGAAMYSIPREDGCEKYRAFELGFPSSQEELLNKLAEDESDYTHTIYPRTPVEVITAVLEKHGGIVGFTEFYIASTLQNPSRAQSAKYVIDNGTFLDRREEEL